MISSRSSAPPIADPATPGAPADAEGGTGGARRPPLVVHVIDRLIVGGMENGLVNVINGTPPQRYRHAIVCLRSDSDFRDRIRRDDVEVFALGKRAGKDFGIYRKVWRLLRDLDADIVHTRNLPTIDMVVPAVLAGAPCRVHGEHGRDVFEPDGGNRKYNALRRSVSPWVDRYITVSRDLASWLVERVGVPAGKVAQIYNGVDSEAFRPPAGGRAPLPVDGFAADGTTVIGTVGRMETVKDQPNLARAFVRLLERVPKARERARLVMIGDGSLKAEVVGVLEDADALDLAWMPGWRGDVPDILRSLDVFVLPSAAEGISNTVLEAMSTALPVVATRVGGNPELVVDGETGALVPAADPDALAAALAAYVEDPGRLRRHGDAGRRRIEAEFRLSAMVERYLDVYDEVLAAKGRAVRPAIGS